jgi:hypothetical protein
VKREKSKKKEESRCQQSLTVSHVGRLADFLYGSMKSILMEGLLEPKSITKLGCVHRLFQALQLAKCSGREKFVILMLTSFGVGFRGPSRPRRWAGFALLRLVLNEYKSIMAQQAQ